MIDKSELLSIADFEATYKTFPKSNEPTMYEKIVSTEFRNGIKHYFIECFNSNNILSPTIKYTITTNNLFKIDTLIIETFSSEIPSKYAEFNFNRELITFKCYEIDKNGNKNLVENTTIDMPDVYISVIETIGSRNFLSSYFPESGIKRCDGFFITVKDDKISYKRTNCELYFDGEEEIEIGLGTFLCTKRRILYTLNEKLTMETFYNDQEDVCIALTKILESPTGINNTTTYEIIERTEKVKKLPEPIVFTEPTSTVISDGMDKIKMGKHSYYDENNKLLGVETWIRNEFFTANKHRTHILHNLNDKSIINIKLKQEITSQNKYTELKVNEAFPPLINNLSEKGSAKYWFYNNKVFFHYASEKIDNRMSSYSSEGYYVFYPLAGLTDLIITKREFPLHTNVFSYAVRFFNKNEENQNNIFIPNVVIQDMLYVGEEYIEVIGKRTYAMKLQIKDNDFTSFLWFDRENSINLRWLLFDNIAKKILLKAELTELNM